MKAAQVMRWGEGTSKVMLEAKHKVLFPPHGLGRGGVVLYYYPQEGTVPPMKRSGWRC